MPQALTTSTPRISSNSSITCSGHRAPPVKNRLSVDWNAPTDAESKFDDIVALATQCRFRNCRYESEPACAVSAAIGLGKLDASHLASYLKVASARHHR
jgi:putative ribosome biogenesis GTPase RsgA